MHLPRVLIKNNRVHHSLKKVHRNGGALRVHNEGNNLEVHQPEHTNINQLKSDLKALSVANVPKPKPKKYVSVKVY